MIIKMTVGDNDFTDVIENFFSNFYHRTFKTMYEDLYEETTDEIIGFFEKDEFIRNKISFSTERITKDDALKLISLLYELFRHYIRYIESKTYILENLKIYITYKVVDKWENGEVVYYFTSNNKFITQ